MDFLARGPGWSLLLGAEGAILRCACGPAGGDVRTVRLRFVGADAASRAEGEEPLASRSHVLTGGDPARWRSGIPHFGAVRWRGVWPGIDVEWHGQSGAAEMDFVVAPGADASSVRIAADGTDAVVARADGGLRLAFAGGAAVLGAPTVYQDGPDGRAGVDARYVVEGGEIALDLGPYDRGRTLVVDPVLDWTTSVPGAADQYLGTAGPHAAASLDASGNVHVTGSTTSTDLPVVNPFQDALAQGTSNIDAFVFELAPDGATLVHSTYLGGTGFDRGRAVVPHPSGGVVVAGFTGSANFPLVAPFQSSPAPVPGSRNAAFVCLLAPDGASLVWSSFYGGTSGTTLDALAVDGRGAAILGGTTGDGLPVVGGFQAAYGGDSDGFVARVAPDGSALEFSTYVGGPGSDAVKALAIGPSGEIVAVGSTQSYYLATPGAYQSVKQGTAYRPDGFVAQVSPEGDALRAFTYLGGAEADVATGVAVDGAGRPTVCLWTESDDVPRKDPVQGALGGGMDAYVARLSADLGTLEFGTYLGGTEEDHATAVVLHPDGGAIVAGTTRSSGLPAAGPPQAVRAGAEDVFVARFAPDGASLRWLTYLGTPATDAATGLAIGADAAIRVVGTSEPVNLPHGAIWPTRAKLVLPAAAPTKRRAPRPGFTARGLIDLGAEELRADVPATLHVGSYAVAIPSFRALRKGRLFRYATKELRFDVAPPTTGSSRARFRLVLRADLTGRLFPSGYVVLRLESGDVDVLCRLRYAELGLHGRLPAAVRLTPATFPLAVRGRLRGAGADDVQVVAGLSTYTARPENLDSLDVGIGQGFDTTIAADAFRRVGDRLLFSSADGAVRKAVVDYRAGRIKVVVRGATLGRTEGALPQPAEPGLAGFVAKLTPDGDGGGVTLEPFAEGTNVVRVRIGPRLSATDTVLRLRRHGTRLRY